MSSMVWDAYAMGITPELGGMPRDSFYRNDIKLRKNIYDIAYHDDNSETEWFSTAIEAQDWAKKNIGKTITRSPDGNGYIVKK